MKKLTLTFTIMLLTFGCYAKESILEKYKDRYSPIANAEKSTDKWIEEFFSYNCNYCYRSEKGVKHYLSQKDENVRFERFQVSAHYVSWKYSLAAFAAAKVAGVEDKLHDPLFKFYHEEGGEFKQFEDMIKFLRELKILDVVDPHFFSDESLDLKLSISDKANNYGITSVPTFIINGAYKLKWGTDMSPEDLTELLTALTALEPTTGDQVAD